MIFVTANTVLTLLLLRVFHYCQLMLFCWTRSDFKSQICRILLSIEVDLNNAVVWIVWVPLMISNSSCPFTSPLGIIREFQLQLVLPSTSCSIVFLVLWQDPGTYLCFRFTLVFALWSAGTAKHTNR